MIIKPEVLKKINNVKSRVAIAADLGLSEQAITKSIERNTPNGTLTKLNYLKAIAKVTGTKDINSLVEQPKAV